MQANQGIADAQMNACHLDDCQPSNGGASFISLPPDKKCKYEIQLKSATVDTKSINQTDTISGAGKKTSSKYEPPFMFAGILAALAGSLMFSFSILCLKLLPEHEGFVGKIKAIFFRGLLISLLCTITILLRKSTFKVKRDELWVNILRSFFGTIAIFGSYISLLYIGMGESTALIFSSPIWTSILGHFLLKEQLHCSQLVAVPISLVGIIFIAHPALFVNVENMTSLTGFSTLSSPDNTSDSGNSSSRHLPAPLNKADQLIGLEIGMSLTDPELLEGQGNSFDDSFDRRLPGIITAVTTSLLVSINYIVLKFRKTTPVQTTTFYLGLSMMMFTIVVLTFTGFGELPGSLREYSLLIGNGILSWAGQSLFQWAFLYEDASILSILRTLDVALSFSLSAIFLKDDIYWTSILGSAIIGFVVISIVLNNYLQQMNCCMRVTKKKAIADNYSLKA